MPFPNTRIVAAAFAAILCAALTVPVSASASPEPGTDPRALLAELVVLTPATTPYDRDRFEEGRDEDDDGCRTRQEVLLEESLDSAVITGTCTIVSGRWVSWYDGSETTDPGALEMDHLVALKEAWVSGAFAWTDEQRAAYANDLDYPGTLNMTMSAVNQGKSAHDPSSWLPSAADARCRYVAEWIAVKYRWRLSVDAVESGVLHSVLDGCGAMTVAAPDVREDIPIHAAAPSGVTPLPAGTHRLSGADRYATAVAISSRFQPNVPVVYIATGTNYPDALSASALAGAQDGPLLLVRPDGIPPVVTAELERLAPQRIVIAGGTGAVSAAVAEELALIAPVERASGADRYATSRALLDSSGLTSTTAFIATGQNFPDALTAGAAAGSIGAGVVLVKGDTASVPGSVANLLQTKGATTVRIVGGTGAVSNGIQASLAGTFPTVTRHGGADRYATGVAVNDTVFATADTVYLAVGTNFADALAGGALAAATDSPLFIVRATCVPDVVRARIQALDPDTIVLLGGSGVLSSAVASLTPCPSAPPSPGPPSRPADVDCSDFSTWIDAQRWFDKYYPYYGDVANLDADNDLIACESLK